MTFPFERVATSGDRALATWGQLKAVRRGVPVVVGDDEAVRILTDAFSPTRPRKTSVADILASADCIRHPEDLAQQRIREAGNARAFLTQHFARHPDGHLPTMIVADRDGTRDLTQDETRAAMLREPQSPPVGEWPATPSPSAGLTVAMKSDQTRLHKVHIALIPTDDWTTVPAHLHWGGWNACPHAEYHVAALCSWRDRFGAELIGLSSDRMDQRVARQPHTRAQALELAREHYIYCNDIVDQGEGTLSRLAACLIADDWWNFWWD
jgi:Domain of unknown function (DUF4253)